MKNQKKQAVGFRSIYVILITFLFLGISFLNINAQEAVTTAGGDASSGGGSVSYTVGQIVYTTATGTNGSVSQGVQQPYEISVSTAIEGTEDIILVSVYPNPVNDILKLKIGERDFKSITYQLFDMKGELIKKGKVSGIETSVQMSGLSPSVYLLKIIEDNVEIKSFKIIKK